MKNTRTGAPIAVALALTTILSSHALAQEGPGLRGTLSFSQSLSYSDNPDFVANPDDGAVLARTNLGFGLVSETRTQVFRFTLGTLAEGRLTNTSGVNDDFEILRDTATLNYTREAASARFSLGATYTSTERDDQVIEVDFDPDALIIDGGEVETIRVSTELENDFGRIGTELRAGYRSTTYTGTSDPDLEDSERVNVDAVARFTINPALTGRLLAGWSRTTEDDADDTTRTRHYLGTGVATETPGGLQLSGDVTFDESRTETTGGTTTEEGVGFRLSATQDRPNGSIGARLSSRVDEDGRLTRASVNRNLELRDGSLSFSVGVIDPEDDDIRPVAELEYATELSRGALKATVSQTPTVDDGDTVLNTAIRLNYAEAINSVSGWSAGLSYSQANTLGQDDDVSRASASIAYRYDLTEAWDLRAGYSYSLREEDGAEDRSENEVFLSLERDFSFGF